jgi:hypothetical protein
MTCTIAIGWEGIYSGSCGDMSRTDVHNAVKERVANIVVGTEANYPGRLWTRIGLAW